MRKNAAKVIEAFKNHESAQGDSKRTIWTDGKTYNGYPSRAMWNVSLWLSNDEGLYNMVKECIEYTPTLDEAAIHILATLSACGATHTPDGCRYTKTAIRHAIRDFR